MFKSRMQREVETRRGYTGATIGLRLAAALEAVLRHPLDDLRDIDAGECNQTI